MSSSLVWQPKIDGGKPLPDALKYALQKRYEGLGGKSGGSRTLSHRDIEYLKGLDDAGVKGAKSLIDAIEKHNDIEIWLVY
jgi:hypothetical protein